MLRGSLSQAEMEAIQKGEAVRVGNRLPGIVPSHSCTQCPTFFQSRDRFYLTVRREEEIHGIAVWPHRQARVRIELTREGLVFLFGQSMWILVSNEAFGKVTSDFFWGHGQREIISWARRRGFTVRIVPTGNGHAALKVDPTGPHFPLLVIKAWAQSQEIRDGEVAAMTLSELGVQPVVYGPSVMPS